MKKQIISFEKNKEISKKAQDKIVRILNMEKAKKITINFVK